MNKNLDNIENTGFNIPEDYFKSLEDQIMNTINSKGALESIESTGFEMPESYLNSVEAAVFSKLSKNDNSKVISIFNRRNLLYLSGVAAAVLLFFSLIFNNNTITIENINIELVETYIINEDLDSYDIAALLDDDELENALYLQNIIMDETLEDYLLENTTIEDLLIE